MTTLNDNHTDTRPPLPHRTMNNDNMNVEEPTVEDPNPAATLQPSDDTANAPTAAEQWHDTAMDDDDDDSVRLVNHTLPGLSVHDPESPMEVEGTQTRDNSTGGTDQNRTADDDSTTVEGGNITSAGANQPSAGVAAEPPAPTRHYFDLQLELPPAPGKDVGQATVVLADALKTWIKMMQRCEASFKLWPWDPATEVQSAIHHEDDFPTTLSKLKDYFARVSPKTAGGRIFTKVFAEFKGSPSTLKENSDWFHKEQNARFSLSSVQAPYVRIAGWLLYSLRMMDTAALADTIGRRAGCQVSLAG